MCVLLCLKESASTVLLVQQQNVRGRACVRARTCDWQLCFVYVLRSWESCSRLCSTAARCGPVQRSSVWLSARSRRLSPHVSSLHTRMRALADAHVCAGVDFPRALRIFTTLQEIAGERGDTVAGPIALVLAQCGQLNVSQKYHVSDSVCAFCSQGWAAESDWGAL